MLSINKKLAYGLWAVSVISALIPMVLSLSESYYFSPISVICTLLVQLLLGYQIYRDKNDFQTMITVIAITIFSLYLTPSSAAGFSVVADSGAADSSFSSDAFGAPQAAILISAARQRSKAMILFIFLICSTSV